MPSMYHSPPVPKQFWKPRHIIIAAFPQRSFALRARVIIKSKSSTFSTNLHASYSRRMKASLRLLDWSNIYSCRRDPMSVGKSETAICKIFARREDVMEPCARKAKKERKGRMISYSGANVSPIGLRLSQPLSEQSLNELYCLRHRQPAYVQHSQ